MAMSQTLLCLQHSKTYFKWLGLHHKEVSMVGYLHCLTGGAKFGL